MKIRQIALGLFAAGFTTEMAWADNGRIFEGIVDIPRIESTAPMDGCAKVTKGLINNGGFLLFTCEKLVPYLPITEHEASFTKYQTILDSEGWQRTKKAFNKATYVKTDAFGCQAHLEMTLWKDRSMNELPAAPASKRDAHRQIVFMAKFYGSACDRYYPLAEAMARP